MSNIILPWDNRKKAMGKDCVDFCPMNDGTLVGDSKYCSKSFICKQIDMKSDYTFYTGIGDSMDKFGNITPHYYKDSFDYLCTGIVAKEDYRREDVEAT